jgi:hypothetical protein
MACHYEIGDSKLNPDRKDFLKDHLVYAGFFNPDTRSVTQEAAQQSAAGEAAQRRNEYDTRQCERSTAKISR